VINYSFKEIAFNFKSQSTSSYDLGVNRGEKLMDEILKKYPKSTLSYTQALIAQFTYLYRHSRLASRSIDQTIEGWEVTQEAQDDANKIYRGTSSLVFTGHDERSYIFGVVDGCVKKLSFIQRIVINVFVVKLFKKYL
jgi:hypothetical protein